MSQFSDYIIFADETGDHALQKIDSDYPVFGLAFCIFKKEDYVKTVSPAIQMLKMDYWGHDNVILHEHDIRKEKGHFAILRTNPTLRENFLGRLSTLVQEASFHVIQTVIDKEKLKKKYAVPYSPYEIALLFCMERTLNFLKGKNQMGKRVPILFECRGKREDNDLELEFRRICDNKSRWGYKEIDFQQVTFELEFSQKSLNVPGLQISDLVARPIALQYLRPDQQNKAYEIIAPKIYGGTKCFP